MQVSTRRGGRHFAGRGVAGWWKVAFAIVLTAAMVLQSSNIQAIAGELLDPAGAGQVAGGEVEQQVADESVAEGLTEADGVDETDAATETDAMVETDGEQTAAGAVTEGDNAVADGTAAEGEPSEDVAAEPVDETVTEESTTPETQAETVASESASADGVEGRSYHGGWGTQKNPYVLHVGETMSAREIGWTMRGAWSHDYSESSEAVVASDDGSVTAKYATSGHTVSVTHTYRTGLGWIERSEPMYFKVEPSDLSDVAAQFYILRPDGDRDDLTDESWLYVGEGAINAEGLDLVAGQNQWTNNVDGRIVEQPDDGVIINAIAELYDVDPSTVKITATPYKITYPMGWVDADGNKHLENIPCYHVDLNVSVTTPEFVAGNYMLWDAGENGFERVDGYKVEKQDGKAEVLAPEGDFSPEKTVNGTVYRFVGWYDNEALTGDRVEFPCEITDAKNFYAKYEAVKSVTYDWDGLPAEQLYDADGSEVSPTLPDFITGLVKNERYTVDTEWASGTVLYTHDEFGNVDGKYTFSGWTDPNNGVMGDADVEITGSWTGETVEVPTWNITYEWSGDVPSGDYAQVLPTDAKDYRNNELYTVDPKYAEGYTITTYDEWGNANGKYTFSGWDTKDGRITSDLTITGTWAFTAQSVESHEVTYDWGKPTFEGVREGEVPTLPTDNGSYVPGQNYTVDKTYAAGASVNSYDAYGNVNGTWTFSGWTDLNNGVMGNSNVTITGEWTYAKVEVDIYTVTYRYDGAVPEGAPALPSTQEYVLNQPVKVATDPAFANWTFSGWDTEDFTMPDHDVVISGSWSTDTSALSVSNYSGVYDGESHGITVNGLIEGDVVSYSVSNSFTDVTGSPVSVTATVTRNGVAIWTGTATVSITPATIRVTISDATKVEGQVDPGLESTYVVPVAGEFAGFEGSIAREPGEEPGTYVIGRGTLVLVDRAAQAVGEKDFKASNYTLEVVPGTFTITAAPGGGDNPGGGTDTPDNPGGGGGTDNPGGGTGTNPGGGTGGTNPGGAGTGTGTGAGTGTGTGAGTNPAPTPVTATADDDAAAADEAIDDDENPLADDASADDESDDAESIDDDSNPLASGTGSTAEACWVHWAVIVGIIVTVAYFAVCAARTRRATDELASFEDDVLDRR